MATFDVLCIGNAIVDVLSRTDDAFLETNGIVKGAMNLIDADRAELLYGRLTGPATEMSGGSAGNTAAGIASIWRMSAAGLHGPGAARRRGCRRSASGPG